MRSVGIGRGGPREPDHSTKIVTRRLQSNAITTCSQYFGTSNGIQYAQDWCAPQTSGGGPAYGIAIITKNDSHSLPGPCRDPLTGSKSSIDHTVAPNSKRFRLPSGMDVPSEILNGAA